MLINESFFLIPILFKLLIKIVHFLNYLLGWTKRFPFVEYGNC